MLVKYNHFISVNAQPAAGPLEDYPISTVPLNETFVLNPNLCRSRNSHSTDLTTESPTPDKAGTASDSSNIKRRSGRSGSSGSIGRNGGKDVVSASSTSSPSSPRYVSPSYWVDHLVENSPLLTLQEGLRFNIRSSYYGGTCNLMSTDSVPRPDGPPLYVFIC